MKSITNDDLGGYYYESSMSNPYLKMYGLFFNNLSNNNQINKDNK